MPTSMRTNMDFGSQSVRLTFGSEEVVLPLQPDANSTQNKLFEGEKIVISSEDFIYDSNAGLESSEEELFLAIREDCSSESRRDPAGDGSTTDKEEKKEKMRHALRARRAHLKEETQVEINGLLRDTVIVTWTIEELRPATVPTKHSFRMKEPTPIYHMIRRTSPRYNEITRRELKNVRCRDKHSSVVGVVVLSCHRGEEGRQDSFLIGLSHYKSQNEGRSTASTQDRGDIR